MTDAVAIVGSGLTGLVLARSLKSQGRNVLLIDKGRKPGGRLLSKRLGDCIFDMGPGWFHTHDDVTPDFLHAALANLSAESVAFDDLPPMVRSGLLRHESVKSWKIAGGIRLLTEELARPLDVLQSIQLKSLKKREADWLLECVDSAHGDDPIEIATASVVLTIPWPQAMEILQKSELFSNDLVSQFAELPDYEKCLVAAFTIENDGAAWAEKSWLELDGDGVAKRIEIGQNASGTLSILIHAHPDFSERHWHDTEEPVLAAMMQEASHQLNLNLQSSHALLQRWKYAKLKLGKSGITEPMVISQRPMLMLAGEAFGLNDLQLRPGILSAQNSARQALQILLNHT